MPLLKTPLDDFAYWLGKFIFEARKHDGSEYPLNEEAISWASGQMGCCNSAFDHCLIV